MYCSSIYNTMIQSCSSLECEMNYIVVNNVNAIYDCLDWLRRFCSPVHDVNTMQALCHIYGNDTLNRVPGDVVYILGNGMFKLPITQAYLKFAEWKRNFLCFNYSKLNHLFSIAASHSMTRPSRSISGAYIYTMESINNIFLPGGSMDCTVCCIQ